MREGPPIQGLANVRRDSAGHRVWTDENVRSVLAYRRANESRCRNPQRTFIDLFSGAGGFSAGFTSAGYAAKAAIEINPIFCRTHEHNFPSAIIAQKNLGTYTPQQFSEETGIRPGQIDVIIGSPPCQTFSTIGIPKIKSLAGANASRDPRDYLFHACVRYVKHLKPRAFVFENVPSMRSKLGGSLFAAMIEGLSGLGYTVTHAVLNSADFGVPQLRQRLIVIGLQGSALPELPIATHNGTPSRCETPLFPNLSDGTLPYVTVGDALSDLPLVDDGARYDELPYRTNVPLSPFQAMVRNGSGVVRNNICRMSNERAKAVFAYMKPGSKYMDLPPDIRRILPFREDIFHDRLKRLDAAKPSWTVLAHIGMDGYMYIHPEYDRTLSVREAARLQGFSDSFIFVGNMREQYVQVGNAVPPPLAFKIAVRLSEALQ